MLLKQIYLNLQELFKKTIYKFIIIITNNFNFFLDFSFILANI